MKRLNVVLVEPEIPPNTGNIARLCVATDSNLHLVHPLGFKTDERHLKRAGLDYWPHVRLFHHESLDAFLKKIEPEKIFLFSVRGGLLYTDARYNEGCYLLFGKETRGLPDGLLNTYSDRSYFIPMWGRTRSLNLSTAAGIIVYEAYKQMSLNFSEFNG